LHIVTWSHYCPPFCHYRAHIAYCNMVSLLSTILYFYGNFVAKMEDEGEKEMRVVGHMRALSLASQTLFHPLHFQPRPPTWGKGLARETREHWDSTVGFMLSGKSAVQYYSISAIGCSYIVHNKLNLGGNPPCTRQERVC